MDLGFKSALLVGALVLVAGAGPLAVALPSGGQNETTATATPAATATTTPTATATTTPTATPTESRSDAEQTDANIDIVIEHWEDRIQVVVLNETLPPALDSFEVRGASMDQELGTEELPSSAQGSVEKPTTVEVVAVYEDGSEEVVHSRRLE